MSDTIKILLGVAIVLAVLLGADIHPAQGMTQHKDGSITLTATEVAAIKAAARQQDAEIARLQKNRAQIESCVRRAVDDPALLVLDCFGPHNPRTGRPETNRER